eukprot:Pompholyxophrys_punicea_v1_NODE_799_length_1278_cov_2.852003.p1 type:complete len:308 gc:universal NODE_799_length_1278_cov_2.852003:157-1080(+)
MHQTYKEKKKNGLSLEYHHASKGVNGSVEEKTNWFDFWVKSFASPQPDKMELHVPSIFTRQDIYEFYLKEYGSSENDSETFISLETFYRCLRDFFPTVKFPSEDRFARCKTCVTIKNALEKPTISKLELQELNKQKKIHGEQQMRERLYYYTKREQAKQPDVTSFIVDGADQRNTSAPKPAHLSKGTEEFRGDLVKTHVTGVISHHDGIDLYVDSGEHHHDSNLTIHCILQSLLKRKENLGKTFYLQLEKIKTHTFSHFYGFWLSSKSLNRWKSHSFWLDTLMKISTNSSQSSANSFGQNPLTQETS